MIKALDSHPGLILAETYANHGTVKKGTWWKLLQSSGKSRVTAEKVTCWMAHVYDVCVKQLFIIVH